MGNLFYPAAGTELPSYSVPATNSGTDPHIIK